MPVEIAYMQLPICH